MQAELIIKGILSDSSSLGSKVESICSFMDWDRDLLTDTIERFGCSSSESREKIVSVFWKKKQ